MKVASADICALAQSLIAIAILGFWNFVVSNFSGWIQKSVTVEGVTNWTKVFIVPTVLTILCAVDFYVVF